MKNGIVEQSKITAQQIDKDTRGCHDDGIISKEPSKTEGERSLLDYQERKGNEIEIESESESESERMKTK